MRVTVRWTREGDGHDLLRASAAAVAGTDPASVVLVQRCTRCGGPHGRPRIEIGGAPGPDVSLTHAGGLVAVAVTDAPVGIDLEPLERSHADIEAVLLSPREQRTWAEVPAIERPAALLKTWVRKEALLKAIGEGLSVDPRLVSVSRADEHPMLTDWQIDGPTPSVRLADIELGSRFLTALAVLTTEDLDLDVSEAS